MLLCQIAHSMFQNQVLFQNEIQKYWVLIKLKWIFFKVYLAFFESTQICCRMLNVNRSAFPGSRKPLQKIFSQFKCLLKSLLSPFPSSPGVSMGAEDEQQHFELSLQCAPCFLLSSLIITSLPFPSLPLLISLSSSACDLPPLSSSQVIPSFQSLICPHTAFCGTGPQVGLL